MNPQANFPYYNTLDQIFHSDWSANKLARLELVRRAVQTLWPKGHPTRLIHVAGTGGKGSTCRFLEMGFGAMGKSGAFMSPHLFDYRERFSINGEFASQDDINHVWQRRIQPYAVQVALDNPHHTLSFHEVSILVALALYELHDVEWAAIEAGVGGRYDQTRALDVSATVLTNVGGDHAHLLGRMHWQRVLDKAGIARPGVPFLTTEVDAQAREIIAAVCDEVGASLTLIDEEEVQAFEEKLTAAHGGPIPTESLVNASYQKWNAALSLSVLRSFYPDLDPADILPRYVQARLPGRFWRIEENIYADIAHNAEKIRALSGEIEAKFAGKGKILVVGVSGRRAPHEVFAALANVAKTIIVTGAPFKGQDPAAVRRDIEAVTGDTPTLVISDPRQAFTIAKSMRSDDDIILLTGSTYLIEQVLNTDAYLRYIHATFGWRDQEDLEATGSVQMTLPKTLGRRTR